MKDFELLPHNLSAYDALCKMLEEKGHAAIIQATGTGKGYIAMQLIKDNPDKHILFVTSYKANLTHFMTNLEEFSIPVTNVTFTVYPSLSCATENCPFDIIIADEFHRLGAPGFWKDFKAVLDRSPGARLVGFSATPVRHLDNQRDMAQELFGGDVAWELPLDDAILDGLLPAPDYITAAYSFEDDIAKAEKRLEDNGYSDNAKAKELVEKARRTLQNAGGLRKVFEDRLANRHGKYIVFCRSWEHMKIMMKLVDDWFDFCPERHGYRLYSDFRNHKDLDGFAADDSDALKLLFSIDMLNEGVHLAGIDGVIMLRPTQSPNVYFQQLGRALSVTSSKVPQVFDIVDNFAGMSVASAFWSALSQRARTEGKTFVGRFEVAASQVELMDVIRMLEEMRMGWDDWYRIAERYATRHGSIANVIIEESFEGYRLGKWLKNQKRRKLEGMIPASQVEQLEAVGIVWDKNEQKWKSHYNQLKAYVNNFGCFPSYSEKGDDGVALRTWFNENFRLLKDGKLSRGKADLIKSLLPYVSDRKSEYMNRWNTMYRQLADFKQKHGRFPYKNEIDGSLYSWIGTNRRNLERGLLTEDRAKRFTDLLDGIRFPKPKDDENWIAKFNEVRSHVMKTGCLTFPRDGGKGDSLRAWLAYNKERLEEGRLSAERAHMLSSLLDEAMSPSEANDKLFFSHCDELREYIHKHGKLPTRYGDHDKLGKWVGNYRQRLKAGKLSPEREKALREVLGLAEEPLKNP